MGICSGDLLESLMDLLVAVSLGDLLPLGDFFDRSFDRSFDLALLRREADNGGESMGSAGTFFCWLDCSCLDWRNDSSCEPSGRRGIGSRGEVPRLRGRSVLSTLFSTGVGDVERRGRARGGESRPSAEGWNSFFAMSSGAVWSRDETVNCRMGLVSKDALEEGVPVPSSMDSEGS